MEYRQIFKKRSVLKDRKKEQIELKVKLMNKFKNLISLMSLIYAIF